MVIDEGPRETSFPPAVAGSTDPHHPVPPSRCWGVAIAGLLDRFYDIAVRVLVAHHGVVDKFVGDEEVAIFIPPLAHDEHPAQAIAAARSAARRDGQRRVYAWHRLPS